MGRVEIGPYRILRLLQEGGGGMVYLALDQRLNRRVALKFISVPRDREEWALVMAEARALARLNHRSIVQIFDVVEVRAYVILVMEYVPGTDLADLLQRAQLDLLSVLQLVLDIGAALATAHHAGIVHRDLKPENVLLAPTGHIKLIDFGIASAPSTTVESEGQPDSVVEGSYSSISPEHIRGETVDQRSDLFALGLLMYRLLAGRHPFVDDGKQQIALEDVIAKPHVPLCQLDKNVSRRLSDLVDELLQKDPRDRPKSALGVRQEVLAILRELPLTRGKPLARFMEGVARAEDAVATTVNLPAGLRRGARSHLLSTAPWTPWARSPFSDWQWPLLLCMTLAVVTLATFTVNAWLQLGMVEVSVRRPEVMLEAAAPLVPNANQLRQLLEQAIAWQGNVLLSSAPGSEVLNLQVKCNEHICGMLLRRESANQTISSYTTLLPGAPYAAWQASITQALQYLFEHHAS